jgi:hypothetical protein
MVLRIVPGGLEGRPPVRHFFGALGHKGHGNARTAGASERLLPPPAFGRERGHRGLARRLVALGLACARYGAGGGGGGFGGLGGGGFGGLGGGMGQPIPGYGRPGGGVNA